MLAVLVDMLLGTLITGIIVMFVFVVVEIIKSTIDSDF